MKNGSPDVRLGEAWKGCPPLRLIAVVCLDQAKTSHLQEIVAFEACLLGVVMGNGSNQMQVVLNLSVPTLELVLVQGMNGSLS